MEIQLLTNQKYFTYLPMKKAKSIFFIGLLVYNAHFLQAQVQVWDSDVWTNNTSFINDFLSTIGETPDFKENFEGSSLRNNPVGPAYKNLQNFTLTGGMTITEGDGNIWVAQGAGEQWDNIDGAGGNDLGEGSSFNFHPTEDPNNQWSLSCSEQNATPLTITFATPVDYFGIYWMDWDKKSATETTPIIGDPNVRGVTLHFADGSTAHYDTDRTASGQSSTNAGWEFWGAFVDGGSKITKVVIVPQDDSSDWAVDDIVFGTTSAPPPSVGSLRVRKAVTGKPSNFSSPNFTILVDCSDNAFDQTVSINDGSSKTITNIPIGVTCSVSEPTQPPPPSGYTYGTPTYSTQPQTIVANTTRTITVTNPLTGTQVCMIDNPTIVATCNNSGTTNTGSDDTFTFTINTTGISVGASYRVLSGATLLGTASYNSISSAFGPFPISGGLKPLVLEDTATGTCTIAAHANPPIPCSSGCTTVMNCSEITGMIEDDPNSTPSNGANSENDYACYAVSVCTPPSADLELTKVADKTSVRIGDTITFTLVLTNKGPATAPAVKVRDLLPAGLAFVSATTAKGSYTNATGVWDLGDVMPGSYTLTITATVN